MPLLPSNPFFQEEEDRGESPMPALPESPVIDPQPDPLAGSAPDPGRERQLAAARYVGQLVSGTADEQAALEDPDIMSGREFLLNRDFDIPEHDPNLVEHSMAMPPSDPEVLARRRRRLAREKRERSARKTQRMYEEGFLEPAFSVVQRYPETYLFGDFPMKDPEDVSMLGESVDIAGDEVHPTDPYKVPSNLPRPVYKWVLERRQEIANLDAGTRAMLRAKLRNKQLTEVDDLPGGIDVQAEKTDYLEEADVIPGLGDVWQLNYFRSVREASNRLSENSYPDSEEGEQQALRDAEAVLGFQQRARENRQQWKASGTWERVKSIAGDVAIRLPGFAMSMMATGGLSGVLKASGKGAAKAALKASMKRSLKRATKTGVRRGVRESTERAIRATVKGLARRGVINAAATATAPLAARPDWVLKSTEKRRLVAALNDEDQRFLAHLPGGIADVWIEYAAERSGGIFGKVAGAGRAALLKKATETYREAVLAAWARKTGAAAAGEVWQTRAIKEIGWHGIIAELGEERISEIGHGIVDGEWGVLEKISEGDTEGALTQVAGEALGMAPLAGAAGIARASAGEEGEAAEFGRTASEMEAIRRFVEDPSRNNLQALPEDLKPEVRIPDRKQREQLAAFMRGEGPEPPIRQESPEPEVDGEGRVVATPGHSLDTFDRSILSERLNDPEVDAALDRPDVWDSIAYGQPTTVPVSEQPFLGDADSPAVRSLQVAQEREDGSLFHYGVPGPDEQGRTSWLSFDHPLVLQSDSDLAAWLGVSPEFMESEDPAVLARAVREVIDRGEHDGLIVNIPTLSPVNERGQSVEGLRLLFGHSTAASFGPPLRSQIAALDARNEAGTELEGEEEESEEAEGESAEETGGEQEGDEGQSEAVPRAGRSAFISRASAETKSMFGIADEDAMPEDDPLVTPDMWTGLKTGRPVRIPVFRGHGRQNRDEIYASGAQGAALGKATYWAPSRKQASKYGPEIEEGEIVLENPLVITSDKQLAQWMGTPTVPMQNRRRVIPLQKVRAKAEAAGHDGIIVNFPWFEDVNAEGQSVQRMREIFSHSQAIQFPPDSGPEGGQDVAGEPEGPESEGAPVGRGADEVSEELGGMDRPKQSVRVMFHDPEADFTDTLEEFDASDPESDWESFVGMTQDLLDHPDFKHYSYWLDFGEEAEPFRVSEAPPAQARNRVLPAVRSRAEEHNFDPVQFQQHVDSVYREEVALGNKPPSYTAPSILDKAAERMHNQIQADRENPPSDDVQRVEPGDPSADPIMGGPGDPREVTVRRERPEAPLPQRQQVNLTQVIDAMAAAIAAFGRDIPIRYGRFAQQANGIFKVGPEVIRLLRHGRFTTAAHEAGHAIEKLVFGWPKGGPWRKPVIEKPLQDELYRLGKQLYGNRIPVGGYKREGFAEFMRLWMTNRQRAREEVPQFADWFDTSFLESHPNGRKALDRASSLAQAWAEQGSYYRFLNQIVDTGHWRNRLRTMTGKFSREAVAQSWLDELSPLRDWVRAIQDVAGEDLPIDKNPYEIASALRLVVPTRLRMMIEDGMIDFAGNRTGAPALADVRAFVPSGKRTEFAAYLIARRARALWLDPKGARDPGFPLRDAEQVIRDLETEEFEKAADIFYRWNAGVLDYLAQSSPTAAEVVRRIRKRDPGDYAPMNRFFEDGEMIAQRYFGRAGTSKANTAQFVERLKGSGRRVREPLQQAIVNAERLMSRAHHRRVIDAILRLRTMEGAGGLIEEVPRDRVPALTQSITDVVDALRQKLKQDGRDIQIVDDDGTSVDESDYAMEAITFFTQAQRPGGVDPIVPIYTGGQLRWFQVPASLYDTLSSMDPYRLPAVVDMVFGVPARMMRAGNTALRPAFGLITNPLRDIRRFYYNSVSTNPFEKFVAYVGSMANLIGNAMGRRSEWLQTYRRLGVEMAQILGQDIPHTRRVARRLTGGWLARVIDPRNFYDVFRDIVQIPEAAPRLAEMKIAARRAGWTPGTPMTQKQAYEMANAAKRVTVDFTAAGEIAKKVNQVVPFFNAAIQGPRATGRAIRQNPLGYSLTALTFASMSLKLWWMNRDEAWWKDMPAEEKALYWHFPVEIGGRKEVLRLPLDFDMDLIWSSLLVTVADAAYRDNPEAVSEWMATFYRTSMPGGTVPVGEFDIPLIFSDNPVVSEAFQQYANRDFFWDQPIVSEALSRKPLEEQHNEYTSRAAITLGELFGASPQRIDHAIRGFGGGAAADLMELLGLGPKPQERESEPADFPLFGRLFRRGGTAGTRTVPIEDLYETLEEAETKSYSDEHIETAKERELRLMLRDATRALAHLRDVREETSAVKVRRALTREMTEIARDAVRRYRNGTLSPERQGVMLYRATSPTESTDRNKALRVAAEMGLTMAEAEDRLARAYVGRMSTKHLIEIAGRRNIAVPQTEGEVDRQQLGEAIFESGYRPPVWTEGGSHTAYAQRLDRLEMVVEE